MLSDRKLAANRLNAQKSTGPKTPDGKSRASLNALKTGIFCGSKSVLPGESQADYNALRDAIFSGIDQNDSFELVLAERMIAARWKIARLNTAERRMHNDQSEDLTRELDAPVCKSSSEISRNGTNCRVMSSGWRTSSFAPCASCVNGARRSENRKTNPPKSSTRMGPQMNADARR